MGRLVEPVDNVGVPFGKRRDQYAETVAKYVPAETIAGYLPVARVVQAQADDAARRVYEWSWFAFGLAFTWLYLSRQVTKPEQRRQVVLSSVAFVFWAAALGSPFSSLPYYRDYLPALLVGAFTWIAGLFPPRARVQLSKTRRT